MTSDLNIYRTASVLIREHGEDAALEADAMLEKNSLDGQRVWKRVLAAVKEIQRQEPRPHRYMGWRKPRNTAPDQSGNSRWSKNLCLLAMIAPTYKISAYSYCSSD